MSKIVSVKLDHPLVGNGVEITELNFRRPTLADTIRAEREGAGMSEMEVNASVLAIMAGVDWATFQTIDMADMRKVIVATAEMLGNGQTSDGEALPS
jgi:hypothetical protein